MTFRDAPPPFKAFFDQTPDVCAVVIVRRDGGAAIAGSQYVGKPEVIGLLRRIADDMEQELIRGEQP